MENLVSRHSEEFDIENSYYFNPIGGLGWYINKLFNYNSLNDTKINRQILFFDKYIVPISKLISPMTKTFFGQSLIIILKKK